MKKVKPIVVAGALSLVVGAIPVFAFAKPAVKTLA